MTTRPGPAYFPPIRRGRPVFLSGAEGAALRHLEDAGVDVGVILQPGSYGADVAARYRVWAADNGCYAERTTGKPFDPQAWIQWLASLPSPAVRWGNAHAGYESRQLDPGADHLEIAGCLFATAPDVVGDAAATWARSRPWLATIRALGFPAALVGQDGLEGFAPAWDHEDDWDVLFIGGNDDGDEWKESEDARGCVRFAQSAGKWVHMGRVNTRRRLRLAASWGVDSVDGTTLAFGPDANAERLARWLNELAVQRSLFDTPSWA